MLGEVDMLDYGGMTAMLPRPTPNSSYSFCKISFSRNQSAIVGTQQLTLADAVSMKKPQGRYKLTSESDRTTLCTPRCYDGSYGCSISIVLTYFCKMYV